MSAAAPLASESPACPDAARPAPELTLQQLEAGHVFIDLRENQIATRSAILEAVLAHFAGTDTRIVWIGNPLRSPLTIERVFLQAAGPGADLRVERTPAELASMLLRAAEGAPRSLLIVQQPETLDPEARETLARVAPHLQSRSSQIQFVFCGTSAFQPIEPELPRPQRALQPIPVEPLVRPPRRETVPLLILLIVVALGAMMTASVPTGPAGSRGARPVETGIAADAAEPARSAPAPQPSQPLDVAALRREFDAFLTQQPRMAALTPEERDALFNEFLQRQRTLAPGQRL